MVEDKKEHGARLALKLIHREAQTEQVLAPCAARSASCVNSATPRSARRERRRPRRSRVLHDGDVEGETLGQIIASKRRFDAEFVRRTALSIVGALEHAHRKGVVHRDLKPSNIIVGKDENGAPTINVLDFGIAKILEGAGLPLAAGTLSANIGLIGTFHYMSPEQFSHDEVDGRSDLYALGVILHEMVTGAIPFGAPGSEGNSSRSTSSDRPANCPRRVD
ncbi:MAG: serine/threonine-protein kinase [Planctomycetota bacterium]